MAHTSTQFLWYSPNSQYYAVVAPYNATTETFTLTNSEEPENCLRPVTLQPISYSGTANCVVTLTGTDGVYTYSEQLNFSIASLTLTTQNLYSKIYKISRPNGDGVTAFKVGYGANGYTPWYMLNQFLNNPCNLSYYFFDSNDTTGTTPNCYYSFCVSLSDPPELRSSLNAPGLYVVPNTRVNTSPLIASLQNSTVVYGCLKIDSEIAHTNPFKINFYQNRN